MQTLNRFKKYLKVRKQRATKAFSLVTVLCSGLIGAMWIAGAYSMLVPLLQQSSAGKQSTMMRTLAETAVDFVSLDISNCFAASQQSKYDDPEVGAPYTTFDLTPAQLGIEDSSNKNVSLSIVVKNEYPASEQDSATYDFQTVPSVDTKKQWSMVNGQNVGWRTIEVHVGLGSTASAKAVYRAMMRPDFGGISYGSGSGGDPGKSPFFPNKDSAFSTTAMSVGSDTNVTGNLITNGSRFGSAPLNIAGSKITINGDVTVNSLSLGSDDLVAQGSSTNPGIQPKIKGFVSTNGDAAGFDSSKSPDPSSVAVERPPPEAPNYKADGDLIVTQNTLPQTEVAPAPTAPADATDLGAIGLSGDAKLVIRDGPVDIPAGQSLANLTSGTASIPPGDYKISSIDVSGSSTIQVADASSLSQPASFYVDNVSGGNSAVNIGGSGVSNSTPGNFQVWYNGTNNVTVSGVQASMTVYAPNAKITVASTRKNSPTKFTGALLGNTVAVSNANLTFETPSASTKNGSTSGQMMYDVTSESGKSLIKPHGLKRILWQELNYSDYIKQGNAPF